MKLLNSVSYKHTVSQKGITVKVSLYSGKNPENNTVVAALESDCSLTYTRPQLITSRSTRNKKLSHPFSIFPLDLSFLKHFILVDTFA